MKKILLFAFVGIFAVGAMQLLASGPKPPTEDQKRNLEEMKKTAIISGAPDCEGDSVILEMGEVQLKVPRGQQFIHSNDIGPIQGLIRPRENYRCDDVIKQVITYRDHPYLIGLRPERGPSSTYQSAFEFFEKNKATLDRSTDEYGVERIRVISVDPEVATLPPEGSKSEYLVMPKDLSPTDSGEPIVYSCEIYIPVNYTTNYWCRTTFYDRSGLLVNFRFPRQEPDIGYILTEHSKAMELLKSLIIYP